jgi:hypothetical protein
MSDRRLRVGLIVLGLGITAREFAFAGPPYVTDDTETPPRTNWEINIAYVLQRTGDPRSAQIPTFDFNYGLRDAVQLKFEMPVMYVSTNGASDEFGAGDAKAGVKWRFLEETAGRPQLAIYPAVSAPTGDESRGLGGGTFFLFLPLIVEKNWGPWMAYANAGWVVPAKTKPNDYGYYGATLSRETVESLRIGAEIYGNGKTEPEGPKNVGWNAGLEWTIVDCFTLLASGGHSLRGEAGMTLYVGGQFHLGDEGSE